MALVGTGPVGMIAGASAGALLAILGKDSFEKLMKGESLSGAEQEAKLEGADPVSEN